MRAIATLFLLSMLVGLGIAEQYATTEDGKKVILNNDGTWKYTDGKLEDKKNIVTIEGTKATLTVLEIKDNIPYESSYIHKLGEDKRLLAVLFKIDNTKRDVQIQIVPTWNSLELKDNKGYSFSCHLYTVDKVKPIITTVDAGDVGIGWITFEANKTAAISSLRVRYKHPLKDAIVSPWLWIKDCLKADAK